MRYISKKEREPAVFTEWKSMANEEWQPTFQGMNSEVKRVLKTSLIEEQLGLCCYCESALPGAPSHIEHFRPQESFPEMSLEYRNMHCSCQSNLRPGEPAHCGTSKGNWFDEELLISPLDPECATHFLFSADGRIHPACETDEVARETIVRLNLNCHKLIESRKNVLNSLLDFSLSEEEMSQSYLYYIKNSSAEEPHAFLSAVTVVVGQYFALE